jgi:serine/threonine protein kinase
MITIREQTQIRGYVLMTRLSQTNMGQVWKARDVARSRVVALKMLRDDLVEDSEFRSRFEDESRRHSRLEHPHIVPVYDFFAEDNLLCLVMRYIEGQSLGQLLDSLNGKPLPIARALRISQQVLGALDYAHRNRILHRDVKPSNILLDGEDNAYLIDFGIALAIGDIRKTRVGGVVGTPLYMSPEQIRTPRQIDQRSDVYSYGCVLYEMTTGRPPFSAGEETDPDFAIRQAHLNETPPRPKNLNPAIPDAWEQVILDALKKDPDERISGCHEFSRLLEEAAVERSVPGPKRRWRAAVGALVAVAAVSAVLPSFLKPETEYPIDITPSSPLAGQEVTIRLRPRRATNVGIQPPPTRFDPAQNEYFYEHGFTTDTELSIVASNLFGRVERRVPLRIKAPEGHPEIDWSVSPLRIREGEAVRIRWNVRNADSAVLTPTGSKGLDGDEQVTPVVTTTYSLTAFRKGNSPTSKTQEVVVEPRSAPPPQPLPPAPTVVFRISPETIERGQSATLSWQVTDADTVKLNGRTVSRADSASESPMQTTNYTLEATGRGGTSSTSKSLTVNAPPPRPPSRLGLFFTAVPLPPALSCPEVTRQAIAATGLNNASGALIATGPDLMLRALCLPPTSSGGQVFLMIATHDLDSVKYWMAVFRARLTSSPVPPALSRPPSVTGAAPSLEFRAGFIDMSLEPCHDVARRAATLGGPTGAVVRVGCVPRDARVFAITMAASDNRAEAAQLASSVWSQYFQRVLPGR